MNYLTGFAVPRDLQPESAKPNSTGKPGSGTPKRCELIAKPKCKPHLHGLNRESQQVNRTAQCFGVCVGQPEVLN